MEVGGTVLDEEIFDEDAAIVHRYPSSTQCQPYIFKMLMNGRVVQGQTIHD